MDLFDGYQYTEGEARAFRNKPFIRTHFDQYTKVFDLSEFQLSRTDEDLFKSNRSMLSPGELQDAVDTLDKEMNQFSKELGNHLSAFFDFMELDSAFLLPQNNLVEQPIVTEPLVEEKELTKVLKAEEAAKRDSAPIYYPEVYERIAYWQNAYITLTKDSLVNFSRRDSLSSFIDRFDNFKKRDLNRRTVANVRSILSESEKTMRLLNNHLQNKVRNQYEKHSRYSMAVICFIFVFIGAPMGALVKKGGFGYPILIAIIFFMLFVVLTIFCKKIAESYVLPAILSAWMPCLVLFPIGLFLTIRAMNKS
jgi:lipopolysaccharide export system permease protein